MATATQEQPTSQENKLDKYQVKKGLRYYYVGTWAHDEWLKFRHRGIGGSEVAAVAGLNPYLSATELYYLKLGLHQPKEENMAMFMGHELEATVAELASYWEGTADSVRLNKKAGKVINKYRKVNAYIINPKYPNFFASLDRKKQGKEEILECKTISAYASDKWKTGIPPYQVAQVQWYLGILGYQKGEMAVLKDNRDFNVYPFEFDQETFDGLVEAANEFWKWVEEARPYADELIAERAKPTGERDAEKMKMCKELIERYEPYADGCPAYEGFMKGRYSVPFGSRPGTTKEWRKGLEYIQINNNIKGLKEDLQLVKNQIIGFMKGQEVIDFGKEGKITYKLNKKGNKTLRVSVVDGEE